MNTHKVAKQCIDAILVYAHVGVKIDGIMSDGGGGHANFLYYSEQVLYKYGIARYRLHLILSFIWFYEKIIWSYGTYSLKLLQNKLSHIQSNYARYFWNHV